MDGGLLEASMQTPFPCQSLSSIVGSVPSPAHSGGGGEAEPTQPHRPQVCSGQGTAIPNLSDAWLNGSHAAHQPLPSPATGTLFHTDPALSTGLGLEEELPASSARQTLAGVCGIWSVGCQGH